MIARRWDYRCGRCGLPYSLPGADLSFFYGRFLGVTRTGRAALLDTLEDTTFDDVADRVNSSARTTGLTDAERIDLVQGAVEVVYDRADDGERFVIAESPGCPSCGSRSVGWFTETAEVLPVEVTAMTHVDWDSCSEQEREKLIDDYLQRRTDGR